MTEQPKPPRTPPTYPICGSRLKQTRDDGRTECWLPAGQKTDHPGHGRCYLHGGRSASGRQYAQKQAAEALMKTYGIDNPIPTDAVQGLLQEIARTAGHIAWLSTQIGDLTPEELIKGETSLVIKKGFENGTSRTIEAAPHILLELYLTERKHFARVCSDAVRAGIAERQINLAEQQGQMFGEFLTKILDGLSLTEEQVRRVPNLVEQHLRLVV